ncbi:MAG: MATE family efflux transporter [Firmicutes bacterium]|nr:MATE family efflux transporter [Bacillota bacterium]
MKHKLIGTKEFYRMVLAVTIPVVIQNGLTNFINLLDNIMVGRMGTEPMSGVAIVNQLFFVFNLLISGGVAGAGIFTAQYYGKGDMDGVRNTIRAKLWIVLAALVISFSAFLTLDTTLIGLYLNEDTASAAATLEYAKTYLYIMLIGLIPFAVSQCYASSLRETGETVLPMKASAVALLVNLVLDYVLIFGKLGLPAMGVAGAAIATVLARFAEMLILVITAHLRSQKYTFLQGLYHKITIPVKLIRIILIKGLPLMMNELLWAAGIATVSQCYSMRGLDVVAAQNIASTFNNLFSVIYFALGCSIAIVVGQKLGAGEIEEAKQENAQMIVFNLLIGVVSGIVLAISAPFLPLFYNTSETVRSMATQFLWIIAAATPFCTVVHCAYYSLRTGGKTGVAFLFDTGYTWLFMVPLAFFLGHFTTIDPVLMYLLVQGAAFIIIKTSLAFILLKKCNWATNIIN